MKKLILLFLLNIPISSYSNILYVGLDTDLYQYNNLQSAASVSTAGDTIMMTQGIYSGGEYIENLKGNSESPIVIMVKQGDTVIYRGGSQAFHMTDPEYLVIDGLVFEEQSSNGVNIDDGGTYETPANNITIKNCHWKSMNASGNNDELKLSGLNNFLITNCIFENGSLDGSLIDMVGCHSGTFLENQFENGGSNCIQAKGGTSEILIERNLMVNGGLRGINIGGSTGLQFFRPIGVDYEAKNILIHTNVFLGSQTPVAFAGSINCQVVNNTFFNPEKWAFRILQESVEGFQPCGNNSFVNNICYLNNSNPNFVVNVGPNTAPETFFFSNNLWYNFENTNWQGPNLPVSENDGIIGSDPMFEDLVEYDLSLKQGSPAISNGFSGNESIKIPLKDFNKNRYSNPPSIGAVEGNLTHIINNAIEDRSFLIYPNPVLNDINIKIENYSEFSIMIYDINGKKCFDNHYSGKENVNELTITFPENLTNGVYLILFKSGLISKLQIFIKE